MVFTKLRSTPIESAIALFKVEANRLTSRAVVGAVDIKKDTVPRRDNGGPAGGPVPLGGVGTSRDQHNRIEI